MSREDALRGFACALALALLACGCGGKSGSGGAAPVAQAPPPPPPPGAPPPPAGTPDSGATGSWANRLLASATYRSLRVEVDYVTGQQPSASALALAQQRLSERLQKPDGVTVALGNEITSGTRGVYSVQDNLALERTHRSAYANGAEAAVYVCYLNGKSDQDTSSGGVLGWAYTGTSIGIFRETIQSSGTLLVSPPQIEGAVLVHELGHLLGLVAIGSPPRSAHHDAAHGAHCTQSACVQFWQVDSTNVIQLVQNLGQLPTDWDAACKQDLQANGGK